MSTTSLFRRENSLQVLADAMKAVILIGGPRVCTQFRPLSLEVPMPLFPVAGAPLLQHHIEACTKHPEVREILLIGFYQQSREMTRFIQDMQREYGIPIRYLQEYCPLGTAGGIYHFRDQILRGNPRAFFVLNSDVCCNFPVTKMSEFHARVAERAGCIILGTEANETQAVNYGCIVENPETHEVLHYVEKPETFVSNIINAGAYLFTPEIFKQLGKVFQTNHENELVPENRRDSIDLERSLLTPLAGTGQLFVFKMTTGFWSQVKNAGSAIYANRLYLCSIHNEHPERLATGGPDLPNIIGHVRIHPTAMVDPTATLGPNVYVGAGVTIGPGARVKEAIILDRAEVMEHSCILHSIIGWDCILGPWSRVEGSPNDPNPNDPLARVSTESLFNREGKLNPSITILGQGVNVHSELMVLNSIVLPHRELNTDFRNQIIL